MTHIKLHVLQCIEPFVWASTRTVQIVKYALCALTHCTLTRAAERCIVRFSLQVSRSDNIDYQTGGSACSGSCAQKR
eukprot:3201009-Pleurochrysis_carterae.AAC.4